MWLTKLKTALVLGQLDRIASLIDEMPTFETLEEMEQAAYLLQNVKTFLEAGKAETSQILQQLKNTINFLQSTQTDQPRSLNLKF
ncbi:hypothetical protein [Sulfuricurvum sp.]|uniref:hypothetical protein n=1 Tax=Sulfuricurvum sp. TaxID=2025608 RepID=UPI003563B8F6